MSTAQSVISGGKSQAGFLLGLLISPAGQWVLLILGLALLFYAAIPKDSRFGCSPSRNRQELEELVIEAHELRQILEFMAKADPESEVLRCPLRPTGLPEFKRLWASPDKAPICQVLIPWQSRVVDHVQRVNMMLVGRSVYKRLLRSSLGSPLGLQFNNTNQNLDVCRRIFKQHEDRLRSLL
jgi:hypothetical protein